MGGAAVGGEIVEVQGGHIVRSTGRKDRHSKVCTAKGPRDRRVRLAAHTAIQFYDVQDRLGYDRPSKAVDWLIKKAKAAIDELVELPAWHPMDAAATSAALNAGFGPENVSKKFERQNQPHNMLIPDATGFSGKRVLTMLGSENEHMSGFLSPSLDSDVIADTVKSFFPMGDAGGAGESSSSAMQFQSFSTNDLFSRNSINNSQDLRLSLQSFQDSNFLHHHTPPPQAHSNPSPHHHYEHETQSQGQQHVFLTSIPLGFDGLQPLPEQHHPSPVRLRQLPSFTSAGCGDGFSFGSPRLLSSSLSGHNNQFLTSTQRGPLQSSNTPSLRAWMDHPPAGIAISMTDHHYHHPGAYPMRPTSSFSGGIGFSGYGGFSGFNIPARIQGDEEPDDGYSEKPSSASSDSRH